MGVCAVKRQLWQPVTFHPHPSPPPKRVREYYLLLPSNRGKVEMGVCAFKASYGSLLHFTPTLALPLLGEGIKPRTQHHYSSFPLTGGRLGWGFVLLNASYGSLLHLTPTLALPLLGEGIKPRTQHHYSSFPLTGGRLGWGCGC